MNQTQLIAILLCLLASAFFSATEMAFVSANRLHVAVQKKKGSLLGKVISRFYDKRANFMTSILIGNTVSLVVYGIFMASVVEPPLRTWLGAQLPGLDASSLETLTALAQTLFSTVIVLATAEFLPKSVALADPDRFLFLAALPMEGIRRLMLPIVWVAEVITRLFIKQLTGREYSEKETPFNLMDLSSYVDNIANAQEHGQQEGAGGDIIDRKILTNALEFKHVRVRDCLVPRKEIMAIELEEGIEALQALFTESGHSKVPVYKENIDNIVGYCHTFSLFKKPRNIRDILTDIVAVPESMPANELMIRLLKERKSMALVVDEFGGTSGIVTMEDMMEQIFGEIEDEHDEDDLEEQQLDERTFVLSARHEIEDLNERYGWDLPEGDYDTLGGLILDIHHDLPQVGEIIRTDRFSIEVLKTEGARLLSVKLTWLGEN